MSKKLALLALIAMTVLTPKAAAQRQACGPRADMLDLLRTAHQEQIRWIGVATNGMFLLELHTSAQGTWTLTSTDTRKVTCILASGDGWTWGPYGRPI